MAVTRAKATALLNKTEMGLYDDSRANALRNHGEARLAQLVARARTARDRARDLEKRQRLASRTTSGSKSGRTGLANVRTGEKAELLADILTRLETRHRDVAKAAKASARADAKAKSGKTAKAVGTATKTKAAKSATAAAPAQRPASSAVATRTPKQAVKKQVSASASGSVRSGKTPVAKPATARTSTAAKPAASAAKAAKVKRPVDAASTTGRGGKSGITPEQAIENTRSLLEQREAEAKASAPWETPGSEGNGVKTPGDQSPQARSKALALHEAETRHAAINGSISTRGRRNQGKRDHRNSGD